MCIRDRLRAARDHRTGSLTCPSRARGRPAAWMRAPAWCQTHGPTERKPEEFSGRCRSLVCRASGRWTSRIWTRMRVTNLGSSET
eukprot:5965492-Prorocentrum_lima.AAC.1